MSDWAELDAELDRWAEAGRRASLWWRDDDAVEPSAALERLLATAEAGDVPIALAVIPLPATADLLRRLADSPAASVLQHGYAHRNHASTSEKKCELGTHRPINEVLAELSQGRSRLADLAGGNAPQVLVPPWNRMAPEVVAELPALGYRGLSTFGPRAAAFPVAGLRQVNTHADLIDWKGSRGFAGNSAVLAQITSHLRARREGIGDAEEATGILSHHLVHDGGCWDFLARFAERTAGHAGCLWLGAGQIFPE